MIPIIDRLSENDRYDLASAVARDTAPCSALSNGLTGPGIVATAPKGAYLSLCAGLLCPQKKQGAERI
jgi:hypothetical protein